MTEVELYRVATVAYLIGLPFAIGLLFLSDKTLARKRICWGAVAFGGAGLLFIGWAASWPGPNEVTLAMMLGGLFLLLYSACRLGKSCLRATQPAETS